ncbi:MAG: DNA-processing protein DprA [Cellulosilyticaceae bacterium]
MEKIYSLWLHTLKLNDRIKYKVWQKFGSSHAVFRASESALREIGLKSTDIEKIVADKARIEALNLQIAQMESVGIELICIEQCEYPELLRQIPDPPIVLFVRGNHRCFQKPMIAVVGARKCSEYGYYMAQKLSQELAEAGMTVVSGMARGIDEAAHRGAMEKGSTLAVLGTGVDQCYPASSRKIYEQIHTKGCVISELEMGAPPLAFHFPRRNRIISGMCIGTLVIEAAQKSGSLITADVALEQNREVFAVPGNIDSKLSYGTNSLIQKGCKLVMKVQDVLDEFPEYVIQKMQYNKENSTLLRQNILDKVEIIVYDCLSWQPASLETLSIQCKIDEKVVQHALLKLELQGLIQRLPANRYIRNNVNK